MTQSRYVMVRGILRETIAGTQGSSGQRVSILYYLMSYLLDQLRYGNRKGCNQEIELMYSDVGVGVWGIGGG
ncbi:hypothetical protein Tco_0250515 [Tanacetum coccineum]